MLDPKKKERIWHHLLGNYLNTPAADVKKWSKELVKILKEDPTKIDSIGMPKFIASQIQHFQADDDNTFSKELHMFQQECAQVIVDFNTEYMQLMEDIQTNNIDPLLIRGKLGALASKRRQQPFI